MNLKELYEVIGDYDEAIKKLQSDRVINRCVIRFMCEPTFTRLLESYERKDLYGIYQNSFTLTGIASGMCLTNLSNLSYRIKIAYSDYGQGLIQGKNLSEIPVPGESEAKAMFDEIKAEYQTVIDNIEKYLRDVTNTALRADVEVDAITAIEMELSSMRLSNEKVIKELAEQNKRIDNLIDRLG